MSVKGHVAFTIVWLLGVRITSQTSWGAAEKGELSCCSHRQAPLPGFFLKTRISMIGELLTSSYVNSIEDLADLPDRSG